MDFSRFSNILLHRLIIVLLIIGNVEPNPGPLPAAPCSIVSWNCNGIRNSSSELNDFLSRRQVKVACLQETKLNNEVATPRFPDYAIIRRDCPGGGGGGLITLVHHSVPFVESPSPFNDNVSECILIKLKIANIEFSLANVYLPPQSSCPSNFSAYLAPLLVDDTLIVGDINAHSDLWSLGNNDPRGDAFNDELENCNFVILNDVDTPTRPSSNGCCRLSCCCK